MNLAFVGYEELGRSELEGVIHLSQTPSSICLIFHILLSLIHQVLINTWSQNLHEHVIFPTPLQ